MFCHPYIDPNERLRHIAAYIEELQRRDGWKKKYDWRCPECGGQMMNHGTMNKNGDFLLECLVCQKGFIVGDYEATKADKELDEFKKKRKISSEELGFFEVETQITKKWAIPYPQGIDESYITLKDPVKRVDTFEISWCVFKQLANRTGSIPWAPPHNAKHNAITQKAFNAIELNKQYTITVNISVPANPTFWERIRGISYPYHRPYASSIDGLILEENRKGIDRRVYIGGT
jgi:hypothetical protein